MRAGVAVGVAVLLLAGCGGSQRPSQEGPAPGGAVSVDPGQPASAPSGGQATMSRASPPAAGATVVTAAPVITYTFPVVPQADAAYVRDHHDYPATDVMAPCGYDYVAVTSGTVTETVTADTWDPDVNDGATRSGLAVTVVGDDGVRYYGSHLGSIADGITPGARVATGQSLGTVGRTGNARVTPCHVHFGITTPCEPDGWWLRRGGIWPWPYLDSWRGGGQESPAEAALRWRDDGGCDGREP